MTPKQKAGCGIAIIALLVTMPLSYVQTYLLYQYVQVPSYIWILFWIQVPISILVSIGAKLIEQGFADED